MKPGVTFFSKWCGTWPSFRFASFLYLSCLLRGPGERDHGSIDSETLKYVFCPEGSCDSFIYSLCWHTAVQRYLNHSRDGILPKYLCATIMLPEASEIHTGTCGLKVSLNIHRLMCQTITTDFKHSGYMVEHK